MENVKKSVCFGKVVVDNLIGKYLVDLKKVLEKEGF